MDLRINFLALVFAGALVLLWIFLSKRRLTKQALDALGRHSTQKTPSAIDYSAVFPPSQTYTIANLEPVVGAITEKSSLLPENLLKIDSDYRVAHSSTHLYSGFTIGQIRALGSFPDYAKLSGVPAPTPIHNFDINTARPRPYRPFRWPYHQTMSISKLDRDYWLELECTYKERIVQRRNLYKDHGENILQALDGSELACKELMEMALQYLSVRYPQQFEIRGQKLLNHILDTETDLSALDPLNILLNNVPEDFGIMLRDEQTGRYHLRAGVICSSLGWKLGEKIGMGLSGVHQEVPSYKDKMAFSMDRFFTKMPAPKPIQRGSWGLEIGQPLFLPTDNPHWSNRDSQKKSLGEDDVYLRVDWQTLRRLPLSGAIVFNFKALYTPISQFSNEPYIPSLMLKILNEGEEGIMRYKGTWHVEHVAKPALRRYEQLQLENGLIDEDWTVQTLDESPFFPGWQKKGDISAN